MSFKCAMKNRIYNNFKTLEINLYQEQWVQRTKNYHLLTITYNLVGQWHELLNHVIFVDFPIEICFMFYSEENYVKCEVPKAQFIHQSTSCLNLSSRLYLYSLKGNCLNFPLFSCVLCLSPFANKKFKYLVDCQEWCI